MADPSFAYAKLCEKGEGIVQTTNVLASMAHSGESRSGMHNLEVAGANPAPATKLGPPLAPCYEKLSPRRTAGLVRGI